MTGDKLRRLRRLLALAERLGVRLEEVGEQEVDPLVEDRTGARWLDELASGIAGVTHCFLTRARVRGEHGFPVFYVFGAGPDLQRWRDLFRRLRVEIDVAGLRYRPAATGQALRAARDRFRVGAARGVVRRLEEEAERASRAETAGRQLPVLAARSAAAEAMAGAFASRTVDGRILGDDRGASATTERSSAQADGYRAGRAMGTHRGTLGGA